MVENDENIHFYRGLTASCSNCGNCCSELTVTAMSAEIKKIERSKYPGIDFKIQQCFKHLKGDFSVIAKNDAGKCVFMDDSGLCTVHRISGVKLKPLACRMFPLVIHRWADGHVSVDARYLCPSVGMPGGIPLSEQTGEIRELTRLLDNYEKEAKAIYSVPNPVRLDRIRFVHRAYQALLADKNIPLASRLYTLSVVQDFHARKDMFPVIRNAGAGFEHEALDFQRKILNVVEDTLNNASRLPASARIDFRNLLTGFVRDDIVQNSTHSQSLSKRFKTAWEVLRFGLGGGDLNKLNSSCPATSGTDCFAKVPVLEVSQDAASACEDFLMSRMCSMHFCGRYSHHLTYEQGLRQLLIAVPAAYAIAGLFAAAKGDKLLSFKHMRRALTYVDTAFSLSAYFKLGVTHKRISRLAAPRLYAGLLKTFVN
ncbi:MAG: YkgJ family cysteine cluster protein [Victivallales bacterium]|nr:YkgJ family cysteine cluster protein [Victivallales bacterium]